MQSRNVWNVCQQQKASINFVIKGIKTNKRLRDVIPPHPPKHILLLICWWRDAMAVVAMTLACL